MNKMIIGDKMKRLINQIREKETELNVIKKMQGWADGIRVFTHAKKTKPKLVYFLLELNINSENLNITEYSEKQTNRAIDDYAKLEKDNQGNKGYDVVLVGADASTDLAKAYPNYFGDTKEFIDILKKVVNKY